MKPMRVSAVQTEPVLGDTPKNASQITDWMQRAHDAGASLVCFPEACLTGYCAKRTVEAAIGAADPAIALIGEAARDLSVAASFGFMERAGEGKLFVAHRVIDETGACALAYRKTHLGRSEQAVFTQGDELCCTSAAGAAIGVQLCWESHIPDISMVLRARGAEVLLVPFASPLGGERRRTTWERYLPARAYDNGVYVIAANALSRDDAGAVRGGGLAVFGPDGAILASSYDACTGMITCDLDGRLPRCEPQTAMRGASYFDFRRPELYAVD